MITIGDNQEGIYPEYLFLETKIFKNTFLLGETYIKILYKKLI